jgi:GntR family transcriptional regulator, transcriptional repressor for pyruvate dehydrogenase complex
MVGALDLPQASTGSETVSRKGEHVADLLLERLSLHEYAPGTRLPPEREFAAELGVSRASLREALRRLESQRYVVTYRGATGGTYVVGPDVDVAVERLRGQVRELLELLDYRRVVEPNAAALAASSASDSELGAIAEVAERMNATRPRIENRSFDARFHQGIASATHNRYLVNAVRGCLVPLTLGLDLLADDTARRIASVTDHNRIIQALRSRDPGAAADAMTLHLDATKVAVLDALHAKGFDDEL